MGSLALHQFCERRRCSFHDLAFVATNGLSMREWLLSIAPLRRAAEMTRPLFIVQGKNDPRVPLHESEQMVGALKAAGTPVWYLVGKDEGHGFSKKKNADFLFYATIAFIEEHLLK